jgi:hypothetical protein
MQKAVENVIQGFFKDADGPSLLLPDGWFGGRPMENQHDLTFISVRPSRLLIELDDQLLLSITGEPRIEVTTTDLAVADGSPTLVIEGFSQAVFEYLEYVNETPHVTSYVDGRICFVSPN